MKDEYYEYLKKYLPDEKLKDGVRQLREGKSPQYIVGNVDFYGNLIEVNPAVLIPRFETELLVDKVIHNIRDRFRFTSNIRILDIGTGSGCIAIALKKELSSHVVACDISSKALDVARKNAFSNHADVLFLESDIFSNIDGKFDVIVSNPPYIRFDEEIEQIVYDNEPHLALYAMEDGLYFYREILRQAKNFLHSNFMMAFEIGEFQGDAVSKMAYQYLDNICVSIEKDFSGRDRFVFIFSV